MKKKILRYLTLYVSERQIDEFKKEADEKAITMSEAIRRALDYYIDNVKK